MPFCPHTKNDIQEMLAVIGANKLDDLFDEIPQNLRIAELSGVPSGINEMQLGKIMRERAKQDEMALCFLGAGSYEHHIPAAVWELTTRGEFMTAYTPYQAEASQGNLQLIYEYQTMMASLTGMDVSNASLYEGASAVAEAVLMAVRAEKKKSDHKVLVPSTLHPHYRDVIKAIVTQQNIEVVELGYDAKTGKIAVESLKNHNPADYCALLIPQPNFFGVLEDVDALTDWAHHADCLTIAVVNPMSLALLKAPGQWGEKGADIVCGEGQPLGIPMASGGPYFGFICCRKALVRQMPGRIVGKTVDSEGKIGFALTLQAREQHIRRSKATSNICTNQGLLVTAATIYMSLLGPTGLLQVAKASHTNTKQLVDLLTQVPGVELVFKQAFFHEAVIKLPVAASVVLKSLAEKGIVGGYDLSERYPELKNCLLICATETKTAADLQRYAKALAANLSVSVEI